MSNARYAEIYHISPGQIKPGTTLAQILEYRREQGTHFVDTTAGAILLSLINLLVLSVKVGLGAAIGWSLARVVGSRFVGTVAGQTTVDGFDAVIPAVTGMAYRYGSSQFTVDPRDPLVPGFVLR